MEMYGPNNLGLLSEVVKAFDDGAQEMKKPKMASNPA